MILDGSTWTMRIMIYDQDTAVTTYVEDTLPSSETAEVPLVLLKWGADIVTTAPDTDQDVLDAFTVDDVKPGGQAQTVFEAWVEEADPIVAGLGTGYTLEDFWAAWLPSNTAQLRNAADIALRSGPGGLGRGWATPWVFQHEADGTHTEWSF
jgi:hypothetical protein